MSLIQLYTRDTGTPLAVWLQQGPIPWCPALNMVVNAPAAELIPFLDSDSLEIIYQVVTPWTEPANANPDAYMAAQGWVESITVEMRQVMLLRMGRLLAHIEPDPRILLGLLREERLERDRLCEENARFTQQLEKDNHANCLQIAHGLGGLRRLTDHIGFLAVQDAHISQNPTIQGQDNYELRLTLIGVPIPAQRGGLDP